MHLAVTIKSDDNLDDIKRLIEAVRKVLTADQVTILEAPKALQYPYPFPVVTVSEGSQEVRHFGTEAIDVLQKLSESRTGEFAAR
jgi:hypothetical protein